MLSVAEASALILSHALPLEPERVPLAQALGRVLREDVLADADSPRFDCSAMDGYAFREADAGQRLRIAGEVPAGHESDLHVGPGECARIFTGGRLPAGADRIVMQEDVAAEDGLIRILAATDPAHIRRRGENCRAGEILVRSGRGLRPADLAILANCGACQPLVTRKARCVHFATGDELVPPEQTPSGAQVRDCNSMLLASLLTEYGAQLILQQRFPDAPELASAALAGAGDNFDVLFISGGASVGDYDFTRPMLEAAGFTIHLEKVNVRPGKPLIFASRGRQLAFGLPGNPVSHWALFHLFLAPLFTALSSAERSPAFRKGRLEENFTTKANSRDTYWPATAEFKGSEYRLAPLRFISSGDIAGLARANALLKIAPHSEYISATDAVEFILCEP